MSFNAKSHLHPKQKRQGQQRDGPPSMAPSQQPPTHPHAGPALASANPATWAMVAQGKGRRDAAHPSDADDIRLTQTTADLSGLSISSQGPSSSNSASQPVVESLSKDARKVLEAVKDTHIINCINDLTSPDSSLVAAEIILSIVKIHLKERIRLRDPSTTTCQELSRIIEDVARDDTTQNPIVLYYTSAEDASLAENQQIKNPEIPTLKKHFYETDFAGDAHQKLFERIKLLEASVAASWKEYDDQATPAEEEPHDWIRPARHSDYAEKAADQDDPSLQGQVATAQWQVDAEQHKRRAWYGRSLAILQSSGIGKSRLLREMAKVDDGREVSVFVLCLREDYPGSEACVPEPDASIRNFLNTADMTNPAKAWRRWRVKLGCTFEAFWTEGLALLDTPSGYADWAAICDPITTAKTTKRRAFTKRVVASAEAILKSSVNGDDLDTGDEDDRVAPSTSRARAAARAFHAKLGKPWFFFALDEAGGLCPKRLLNTAGVKALSPAVTDLLGLKTACIGEVARLFSKPVNDDVCAERFWLLLADTNTAISALMPPTYMSSSSRIQRDELTRLPPYCPTNADLNLRWSETAMSYLLDLSPIQASAPHVLALKGRPLWQSLVEDVKSGTQRRQKRQSPETAWSRETLDSIRKEKVVCYASPRFVLSKLMCWEPKRPGGAWPLTEDRMMALLMQRVEITPPTTKLDYFSTNPQWFHAFQLKRVQNHLGILIDLLDEGETIVVATANEPLVHMAAAAWFRTNGRSPTGSPDIEENVPQNEEDGPPRREKIWLWHKIWTRYQALMGQALPLNGGAIGEINGAVLWCIAHDCALRRRSLQGDFCSSAYNTESAFVHVGDLLAQLLPIKLLHPEDKKSLDDLLAALGGNAWTSFQKFWRVSEHGFTRSDLMAAFADRYAIIGAVNQPVWDLVVPIYCGDLDARLQPSLFTWIQIQVKCRGTASGSTDMRPVEVLYGDIFADKEEIPSYADAVANADNIPRKTGTGMELRDRKPFNEVPKTSRKVESDAVFRPRFPPIMVWLELSGPRSRKSGQPQEVPTVQEDQRKGMRYFRIEYPLWDARNFPVLAGWKGHFPSLLNDDALTMSRFDKSYRRDQTNDVTRNGIYLPPWKRPQ